MKFERIDYHGSKPLHLQVNEIIEKKIWSREIPIGRKLPTQRELSRIFNVSINTIENAVSGLVKAGYVSAKSKHGTIVISSKPKSGIELKRKNIFCLVVCTGAVKETFESNAFHKLLNAIELAAREKKLHLLYKTISDADRRLSFDDKEKDIAGLIVTGNITRNALEVVKKTKIPFILIGDIYSKRKIKEDVDIITNDDFQGVYAAAKQLIDSGCRKIMYCSSGLKYYSWQEDELNGYRTALKDAGIPFDKRLLVDIGKDPYSATMSFLKKAAHLSLTGIILTDSGRPYFDLIMEAFSESKVKFPVKAAAVNSDNIPGAIMVHGDILETGRKAVERLYERLTDPAWAPGRITVPYKVLDNMTVKASHGEKP